MMVIAADVLGLAAGVWHHDHDAHYAAGVDGYMLNNIPRQTDFMDDSNGTERVPSMCVQSCFIY